MRKELLFACIAIAATGCSNSDCGSDQCLDHAGDSLAALSHSIQSRDFTEMGGDPWGSKAASSFTAPKAPEAEKHFGRTLAVGDPNGDGYTDIITSFGTNSGPGTVSGIFYRAKGSPAQVNYTMGSASQNDGFGAAVAVGKFCPDLTTFDMIVASAPEYDNFSGAIGLVYRLSTGSGAAAAIKLRKTIANSTDYERIGTAIAIGDVDGDGKNDLVFQARSIDSSMTWLPSKVKVLFNFCDAKTADNAKTILTASNKNYLVGSAIYIKDLNGDGKNEIIIVDRNDSSTSLDTGAPNGAIHFYQYDGSDFVPSRATLYGAVNSSIESVAFSDIDGDGDLDLIVGEPMYKQSANPMNREGRVRTYTNHGKDFDPDEAPLWSAHPGRSNARFGAFVTTADVNNDGVDDLIVGAPGWRLTSGSQDRSQAYIYVYMGTKDGSVFSAAPYWSYISNVPTDQNDDFGRTIAVADLDKSKGWLDIVVAAPNASAQQLANDGSTTTLLNAGRIDTFVQSVAPCYTANRCLVAKTCYEAGDTLETDQCMICDPKRANFDFSARACETEITACQESAACDSKTGCTLRNKPDGTSCGDDVCSSATTLKHLTCAGGACAETEEICQTNYQCSDNACAFAPECQSDDDCNDGLLCKDYRCVHECLLDADCNDGYVCSSDNRCVRKNECAADADCIRDYGEAYVCNTATYTCEKTSYECSADAECTAKYGAGYICNATTNLCQPAAPQCTTDRQCVQRYGTGYICETGTCSKAQCAYHKDCGVNEICENSRCATIRCTQNVDCLTLGVHAFCNKQQAQCQLGELSCAASNDCPTDYTCLDQLCAINRRCSSDDASVCKKFGENYFCDPLANTCTPQIPCKTDDECVDLGDAAYCGADNRCLYPDSALKILSPSDGDTIPVKPYITGSARNQSDGVVSVFAVSERKTVELCTANVAIGGAWSCTATTDLAYSTEYEINATWVNDKNTRISALPITVTTVEKPLEEIRILWPANKTVISGDLKTGAPIIFVGTAEPQEEIFVNFYLEDGEGEIIQCQTSANDDHKWQCTANIMASGNYHAYGAYSLDDITKTQEIDFTVVLTDTAENGASFNVSGGSCAMAPAKAPAPGAILFFLLSGLTLLRRTGRGRN